MEAEGSSSFGVFATMDLVFCHRMYERGALGVWRRLLFVGIRLTMTRVTKHRAIIGVVPQDVRFARETPGEAEVAAHCGRHHGWSCCWPW